MKDIKSTCEIEDGYYVLDNGNYLISVNRIDSYEDIVKWVIQLSDKNWTTTDTIYDFVFKACKHSNLSPYGIR